MAYKTYEHQPHGGPFLAIGNFYIGVPVRLPQMAKKAPFRAHSLPVLQLKRACL
jgi:hypothetical protein